MPLPDSVILVCAGDDALRAVASGHPLLQLCLTINTQGSLYTSCHSTLPNGYLGLQDPGTQVTQIPAATIAEALLQECRRTGARGVFADLESDTRAVRALCKTLDTVLYAANIPLFVPPSRAEDVAHAIITFETAISGGSLSERLSEAQTQHGSDRVAALLQPISADFCLPSQTADGTPLTVAERHTLLQQYPSQIFFSRELCAKYFTYMDAEQRGHFVLFDDASTWLAKLSVLDGLHISHCFALYPDAAPMLRTAPVTSAVKP